MEFATIIWTFNMFALLIHGIHLYINTAIFNDWILNVHPELYLSVSITQIEL